MRKRKIEKKLRLEIENSVPDVLNNILAICEEKKGFEKNMESVKNEIKNKKTFPTKLVGALAMAMICICSLFGVNQYNQNNKVDSIIEFDVNPSIELEVNKNEKIIKANALNGDAEKVLEDMNLKNTDLNVAVNAIVGSMLKNGYISNDANSILVSVKNDDTEKRNQLQEKISNEIKSILKVSSVEGAILTQVYEKNEQIEKLAKDNNISEGKAELINKILKSELKDYKGNEFTFETLSKMSINELNLLVKEKQAKVEEVKITGTASESSYIGREKAKEVAYNHANVSSSKVTKAEVELDYDDGKVVYEVDFYVGNTKYEYEINAKTGVVIEYDKEYEGSKEDRDDKDDDDRKQIEKVQEEKNNDDKDKTTTTTNNKSSYIGKEYAKKIAYNHANVSSGKVTKVQIELDDGKYEIDFYVGNTKYEYEINAKTGKVIDYDKEYEDKDDKDDKDDRDDRDNDDD